MGGKKKYINIFGSFTEPFNLPTNKLLESLRLAELTEANWLMVG